ncbi:MAG: tryptophan 7-halogenase [Ardenticatenaceae bacterium]
MVLQHTINSIPKSYHVMVMGGGPAGATTAFRLAQKGYRVVLLERQATPPSFKIGESLPPTVNPLLKELGLSEQMALSSHQRAYGNQSAWGSDQIQSQDFIFNPYGSGWRLDRIGFDDLLRQMAQQAGVRLLWSTRMLTSRYVDEQWQIKVQIGHKQESLQAPWIVDATGRSAGFARQKKIQRTRHDRLIAYVQCFERSATDEDTTTLIESFEQGWWYTASLPQMQRVVVLLTDHDTEAARTARTFTGLCELIAKTKHIQAKLGHAQPQGKLITTAAGGSRLDQFHGEGWLAVGDAALAFDPLSSQGIMTALYCANKAADALASALDKEEKAVFDYGVLLEKIHAAYLTSYHNFYAYENRWPNQAFWQRRRRNRP